MLPVNPYNSPAYRGVDTRSLRQKADDNSTEIAIGAGASTAAFAALKNSSKIGTGLTRAITKSGKVKVEQEAKLMELFTKSGKLSKFAKNPVTKKVAGGLAGLSALTVLVTDAGKIANTCSNLESMRNA